MHETSWNQKDHKESSTSIANTQSKRTESTADHESVANMDFSDYVFFLEEIERR